VLARLTLSLVDQITGSGGPDPSTPSFSRVDWLSESDKIAVAIIGEFSWLGYASPVMVKGQTASRNTVWPTLLDETRDCAVAYGVASRDIN